MAASNDSRPASGAAPNLDERTVEGFGREWTTFPQDRLDPKEQRELFELYFALVDWERLPPGAEGFDLGCGSGRWAALVAPRVGRLHCIDASSSALAVARRTLARHPNCVFHHASVDTMPLDDGSMDFGYALGVLHHVPDPAAALRSCVRKLKVGAPFVLYMYYALENRRLPYVLIWRASDLLRRVLSRCPFPARVAVSEVIAATVYWPLARVAALAERLGLDPSPLPLSFYRHRSFYMMRTDALDRFGTRLEHRFTADQVLQMMRDAGLDAIRLAGGPPYWRAIGVRAR